MIIPLKQSILLLLIAFSIICLLYMDPSELQHEPSQWQLTQRPWIGNFDTGQNLTTWHTARYSQVCQNITDDGIILDNQDDSLIYLPMYSLWPITMNNLSKQIYLYQAYEQPEKNQVIIITIIDRQLYCANQPDNLASSDETFSYSSSSKQDLKYRFKLSDSDYSGLSLQPQAAILKCLPEHHWHRYTAAIIICPMLMIKYKPSMVRLESEQLQQHSEWLSIKQRNKEQSISSVVCVRPLFGWLNVINLLEFIAYYQQNEFERILFYYYEQNQTNDRLIRFLSSLPGVQVKPFPLIEIISTNVHAGGQLATINDCLYEYPYSYQLHVDIDEFVFINHNNDNDIRKGTPTIMSYLDKKKESFPVTYIALYIANVLHCHEFNLHHSNYYEFISSRCNRFEYQYCPPNNATWWLTNHNNGHQEQLQKNLSALLLVANSIFCQKSIWPHQYRSKVILLRPWLVQQMGVHQVWMFNFHPTIIQQDSLWSYWWKLWHRFTNTINHKSKTLLTYLHVDSKQVVLRHFRWCCNLKQTYFFHLFEFETLKDQLEQCLPDILSTSLPVSDYNRKWSDILKNITTSYKMFLMQ